MAAVDAAGNAVIARRRRSTLRRTWEYDETCFAVGLAVAQVLDAGSPSRGNAFYYLVSAVDECGESVIGGPSGGDERFPTSSCQP